MMKNLFTTNYRGCYHLDDSLLWWQKLEADKQELVSWTVTWSVSFVLLLCCSYLPGKPMRVKMGNLWEETMWTSFCCMTLTLTWRTWTCMLDFFFFHSLLKKTKWLWGLWQWSLYLHIRHTALCEDVSRLPVNHPKISSARPAWSPAPKYASVEGCSPLCPVWGALDRILGNSEIPASTQTSKLCFSYLTKILWWLLKGSHSKVRMKGLSVKKSFLHLREI